GGEERGSSLEDEHALATEGQRTADLQRGRGVVHTGHERLTRTDGHADGGRWAFPGGDVVGRGQVGLGTRREATGADLYGAANHLARREPGHRSARAYANVPVDDDGRGVSVGDRGPSQHPEAAGGSEIHGRHRGTCGGIHCDEHGYSGDEHEECAKAGVSSGPAPTATADICHSSCLSLVTLRRERRSRGP